MSRLTWDMNLGQAMMALSEGNPGAIAALMELKSTVKLIDKASVLGFVGAASNLDSNGIYGADIWIIYQDVCRKSVWNMVAMLRAVQLGFISASHLRKLTEKEVEHYGAAVVKELDGEFLTKKEFEAL